MRDRLRRSCSDRNEDGFSLVDILIACSLMTVVLVITTPVVTAFYDVNQNEQQTYNNENSIILASEKLTQYIHEAVAPCPTPAQSGCPTSAFTTTTGSSLTFYADTNSSIGPAKVVVTVTGTALSALLYKATGSCPFNGFCDLDMCLLDVVPERRSDLESFEYVALLLPDVHVRKLFDERGRGPEPYRVTSCGGLSGASDHRHSKGPIGRIPDPRVRVGTYL